mgnify:CR=1 FL=1
MAIPRTAATSFSIGILPITGDGMLPLAIFTTLYFVCAWWLSITPSKLLDRVGKVLTPIFCYHDRPAHHRRHGGLYDAVDSCAYGEICCFGLRQRFH